MLQFAPFQQTESEPNEVYIIIAFEEPFWDLQGIHLAQNLTLKLRNMA